MKHVTLDFKKKHMPTRWDDEQKRLLVHLFQAGKTFEEITSAVNNLISHQAKIGRFDWVPLRTAKAVAIQCERIGLITSSELKSWEESQARSLRKDRACNRHPVRTAVFARDDNKCVICGRTEELELAHIIPFVKTRENLTKEAVTICAFHHRDFDKHWKKTVEKVYYKMCEYSPEFSDGYEIERLSSRKSRIVRKPSALD